MSVVLAALLLTQSAHAAGGDLWGTDILRERLPESAREYMDGDSAPTEGWMERIASRAEETMREQWKSEVRFCTLLLSVVLLCSLTATAGGAAKESVMLAGVAAIAAAAVSDVNSYMELASHALSEMADYADILMPVLAAAGSATGHLGSAAGKCAATSVFMDALIRLSRDVAAPLICGYAALGIANAAVGNNALKTASRLTHSACTLLLGAMATSFTLWISGISLITGAGEEAATRLTKSVLTNALPVVGKMLSDASGALSAAAAAVRGSAGILGIAAVLCICLTPCIRLGLRLFVYKCTAAICQCLCSDRLSSLLDTLGECFAMLLGLLGTAALSLFVAVYSLIRVVV